MSKVSLISLGCPKNQVDGEMMLNKLSTNGYSVVTEVENSDVTIINTCGFIDAAKQEAIETILDVIDLKKDNKISSIVVTGCLAERYQEEIINEFPEIDSVIGIGADVDIVKVCNKALFGVKSSFFPKKELLDIDSERLVSTPSHWAYLKISEGCNNNCAFCAIPGIRGKYRSRTIDSIIKEAKRLVQDGVKELILIAQDSTYYGFDIYKEFKLGELLKQLNSIEGLEWIRVYYAYAERLSDQLINDIASCEKVCNYLDIPFQHADSEILKSMKRPGSFDQYIDLINKLKNNIPNLALRTTLMVGFPGETDKSFEVLCDFVDKVKFDRMGCFAFSPEEDTVAYEMENQIEDRIKEHRQDILLSKQLMIMEELTKLRINKIYKTIVDSFDGEVYHCRTYMESPEIDVEVLVNSENKLEIGSFINCEIIDYTEDLDLIGRVI